MTDDPEDFGGRLAATFGSVGHYCVGIDPHPGILAEWGLGDTADGARRLGSAVVSAAAGSAGIVKPQVAFFERFGAAGYTALEHVIREARDAGLLVLADGKRGDVASSAAAYGAAWLEAGAPLESDALTVSPYLGVGALVDIVETAERSGKGLFVLAATSNPQAAAIQRAVLPIAEHSHTLARGIIEDVSVINAAHPGRSVAAVGVVLGATLDLSAYGIDTRSRPAGGAMPVLAPGFGHQGADLDAVGTIFGAFAESIVVSESRAVLAAGPDRLGDIVARRSDRVRVALA